MNLILLTDSYKHTHWKQYPPGTTQVYSYFESRGGRFPTTTFFGLQYFLLKYLRQAVTLDDVNEAAGLLGQHFGGHLFNRDGWLHIVQDHDGCLPLLIKAVPEGTVVPSKNVLMTVENTCPKCFWLTNIVETLLVQMWYPITVATASRHIKCNILDWLEATGTPEQIDFKLHDFGFRGVSSPESAAIGGAAHLVNFKGSDTLAALKLLRDYYNEPCAGFSIPATEHSTITTWGESRECDAFENVLDQYPTGLVACVSDSYDIFRACSSYWGGKLKEKVLARNGTLIVRPDSGKPADTVHEVVRLLAGAFGTEKNIKGYKVLDPHVRVIQGDGVDEDSISGIYDRLAKDQYSADNVGFGMGGALLQKWNRDDNKFAFKCSFTIRNSHGYDVYKRPVGDDTKASKRGRLALVQTDAGLTTVPLTIDGNRLETVFRNGLPTATHLTLFDIRRRAAVPVQLSLAAA